MTEFWIGSGLLLALAGLFLLFPTWFGRINDQSSEKQDNLDWLQIRRRELEAEAADESLLDEAGLRLLEDGVDQIKEAPVTGRSGSLAWLVLPVGVLAVLLYLQLGAAPDVKLSQEIQALSENTEPATTHELMAAIADRAEQKPDNVHYQAILGRYYMNIQDYQRANETYMRLVDAAPNDASALAMAAQSNYLAAGRVLSQEAQVLAERALNQNPHERSALGLLGMAAFERQQYRAAIAYWERLLVIEVPGSEGAQLIGGVIQRAKMALAAEVSASEVSTEPHVLVRVSLPDGAEVDPAAVVFVFARNPAVESRMPIAVQRFTAAQLPLDVRLDDAASMAGQKISETEQVLVVARITADGQPGEAQALWQGELGPLSPAADFQLLDLRLKAKKF